MNWEKIKLLISLHWKKALLITIAILMVTSLVIMFSLGMQAFNSSEPFYKRSMLAQLPTGIYLYLVVGSITAVIHISIWLYGMRRMYSGNDKPKKTESVNVKWSEIVGMESIKEEVAEVISLIKDRSKVQKVGGKVIKGLLMMGPPGCGKTYIAKAIATETGLPFLSSSGSEYIGIFVGTGAAKMKELFKRARIYSKTHGGCMIFIDEIDTIARPRVGVSGMGGGMSYNATVNQLLTELDGMHEQENIIIIGATNVKESDLDTALMRAGRFDRKIYVNYPNLDDRAKLFKFYLDKVEHDPDIDVNVMAKRTVWSSPATIASIVREASLVAIRAERDMITFKDLSEAYDRIEYGLKENKNISDEDKKWTAYHEAGHAIIGYLTHPTNDVIKATIIPRKGFLGYVGSNAPHEIYTHNREYYLASIKISLGGYVAERIQFNTSTSGVESDMKSALTMAHSMVWRWGMGNTGLIGNFAAVNEATNYQASSIIVSDTTKEKLDSDVQKILKDCLDDVTRILTEEKELLDYFANELLEKEELDYDEIEAIFAKFKKERPNVSSA